MVGGAGLVYEHGRSAAVRFEEDADRYGQLLARPLWDLDEDLARSAMTPLVQGEHVEGLRLVHPNGSLFVEVHNDGALTGLDSFLVPLGLLPKSYATSPIRRGSETIGSIEAHRRNRIFFDYAYALLASVLLSVSLWLAARNALRKRELARVRLELEQRQRVELEVKLQEREQQLMEVRRLEALGRLAGGVAHDFNNILTAILGTASFLEEDVPEIAREDLRVIIDAGNRAAALTRQLLAFGRHQILQPRPLSLNAVILGMERILERALGDSVKLKLELDSELQAVRADPAQLERVILNLVGNAGNASPSGATVTVSTRNTGCSEDGGEWVEVIVSDQGKGMDKETRSRIFEPFFTTRADVGGTGLGLSTAYGIVSQSAGEILVESEAGRGSSFTIRLPAIGAVDVVRPQKTISERPFDARDKTVLVVDDNDAVRGTMVRALRTAGYATLEASCGADAVELAEGEGLELDAMVTDVIMPGMDGLEVSRRVRERRPGLPVVFVSGFVPHQASERLGVLEREILLRKPFGPAELQRALARAFEAKA